MTDRNIYTTPSINYKSITINNTEILLGGSVKCSFQAPYNKIDIVMRPIESSISYYEVRSTYGNADWDIGAGKLLYWNQTVPLDRDTMFSININQTNFDSGDGVYRISMYAKSAIDGSWDVSYLLFEVGGTDQFIPSDADGFEVLTTVDAPTLPDNE